MTTRGDTQYDKIQQTHYNGCWADPKHHACAMREIEQLRFRIREAAKLNMQLMEIRHKNEEEIKQLHFIIEQAEYFMDPKTTIHWHNFIKQYENMVPSI